MASSFAASRSQIVYALCLPLAVLLGYFMAEPMGLGNLALVGVVLGVLVLPILMKWYHPLLILTWNAAITPNFLPGQPFLWMLIAFAGVGIAVLNRFTNPEAKFVDVPSVSRPLLFLLAVVIITAWLRGGIGIRSLGSSTYGGKGYFYILAAVAGYFALISQRIPVNRAGFFAGIFFLAGLTALIPNLAFMAGPSTEVLFWFFPPLYAWEQAMGQYGVSSYGRVYGLTFAVPALYCWLFCRYGLRGVSDLGKSWRGILFLAAIVGCLFCGFRGTLVLFVLVAALQFFFEGLWRTRMALVGVGVGVLTIAAMLPFTEKLPFVVQRTISVLPVEISPLARESAQASSEWRLEMWQAVLPEVPKYLFKGKGYALDPSELSFAAENVRRGYSDRYQSSLTAGDYHNGPLSVVIPFGIWGLVAFCWFVIAGIRYLHRNYREGPEELKTINTFLLVFFTAKVFMFFLVFGAFYLELFTFTGLVGLSVSLNGAAEAPKPVEEAEGLEEEFNEFPARKDLMTT